MKKALITFYRCVQNSQDLGTSDDHMLSSIHFYLDIAGKKRQDLYSIIKQTVGSNFNTSPIEVSAPIDYNEPFNYEAFRALVEKYYRKLVGSSNALISVSGNAKVHMQSNTFNMTETAELELKEPDASW